MTAVAIDGPAGAGKSTVARRVAESLGAVYIDTGAMYRAVALAAIEAGLDPTDGAALGDLAGSHQIVATDSEVTLDGADVAARVREPDVTELVSVVAAHPEVRSALVRVQQDLARTRDVVMEGRDIGTTVLPDAEVKIWLIASLEERAHRRWAESPGHGTVEEIAAAIEARDAADSQRDASPLVKAPDAVTIDTTGLTVDQVIDAVVAAARERLHV